MLALDSFHSRVIQFKLGTSKLDGLLPLEGMVMLRNYSLLHTNASSWHNSNLEYSVRVRAAARDKYRNENTGVFV